MKPFNAFYLGPSKRSVSTSLSLGTRRLDLLSLFSSGGKYPVLPLSSVLHVRYLLGILLIILMKTVFPEVVGFVFSLGFFINMCD